MIERDCSFVFFFLFLMYSSRILSIVELLLEMNYEIGIDVIFKY